MPRNAPGPLQRIVQVSIRRVLRSIHLAIWTVEIAEFGTIRVLATDAHDARRQAHQIFRNANTGATVLSVQLLNN